MKKKFIAPLIFGILAVAVISAYWFIYVEVFKQPWVIVVYVLAVLALATAMFFTLRARYKELKKENEDDYKKY